MVVTVCESANAGNAGLNVGNRRITPGLEKQYLQYQLQNNGNGQRPIFVLPDNCVVGFGLRCNKTGTVLEQILESQGGPTYQQMLMRAAGGEANYSRWKTFLGDQLRWAERHRSNNDPYPYMSVWRNYSSSYLDAAQYGLGRPLNRNPVPGLTDVTKNFVWQPFRGDNLRDSFVGFKLSYGRVLLEEISKIQNIRQEILKLPIGNDMKEFYERQLLGGLNALQRGNNEELKERIFSILSRPYSPKSNDDYGYGRTEMIVVATDEDGETLDADVSDTSTELTGGEFLTELVEGSGEETSIVQGETFYVAALLPLLALVFFLDGDNDSSNGGTGENMIVPDGTEFACTYAPDCNPTGNQQGRRVDEPSATNAIFLLTLILCLFRYRHKYITNT
jgi:hypothetical protein